MLTGSRSAHASAWLLAGLLAISGTVTALPLARGGPAMFAWDDTEYVTQAVETSEYVSDHGLPSWPGYVLREHRVKPPLYVNTLTAALLVFGRERAALAAGVVGGVSIVLFGLISYWIVGRLTNRRVGVAAAAALVALPCATRWFPAAYTDAQLAALVLLAVGLLSVEVEAWRASRIAGLGVTIGLGLLAKTTFLMFVALPLGYWLLRRGGARTPFRRRLIVACQTLAVAAIVALPWYVPHGEGALYYARVSSGFQLGPVADDVFGRLLEWLPLLVARGWGFPLGLIGILGIVAALDRHPSSRSADVSRQIPPHVFAVLLTLSALPMLMLAVASRVPPNTRHPLPSLILIAVAVIVAALDSIDRGRQRVLWPLALAIIGMQFAAATLGLLLPAVNAFRAHPLESWIRPLAPVVEEHRPVPLEAASLVLDRARDLTSQSRAPAEWYLIGASAELNVSRLRMLARLRGVPVNFAWGSYFTWSAVQRSELYAEMRARPCVVVLYEPVAPPGSELAVMNRHSAEARAFVTDPANGFEPFAGASMATPAYTLSFYVPRGPVRGR